MKGDKEWLLPLTGVLFFVLVVASFAFSGGEPPDVDSSAQEIVDHYADNKDAIQITSFIGTVAGAVLIFFFGYVRKLLIAAGDQGMLPLLALIGASIVAIGGAIDNTILFAMAEIADDVEPGSVQLLQGFYENDFMPFVLGMQVLWLSIGISAVRHRAFPMWLGWAAVVIGVIAFAGPVSFLTFPLGGLWILVASIVLTVRARGAGQAAAPTA